MPNNCGVKFRILKCGKNLKENPEYRHLYINEDLTVTPVQFATMPGSKSIDVKLKKYGQPTKNKLEGQYRWTTQY